MKISNNIRALRTAKGWSMERLAEAIGTSTSTINRLEKGETELVSEWVPRIAERLDVPIWDVIGAPRDTPEMGPGAIPFIPDDDHPLAGFKPGQGKELWQIAADTIANLGVYSGDIVVVDTALKSGVGMGEAVIVRVTSNGKRDMQPKMMLPSNDTTHTHSSEVYIVRQFIEPNLLIANHDMGTEPILYVGETVAVFGTIANRFSAVSPIKGGKSR